MNLLKSYWRLFRLRWFGEERDWRQDRQCLNDAPNLREAFDIPQHDLLIERLQKCREWRETQGEYKRRMELAKPQQPLDYFQPEIV